MKFFKQKKMRISQAVTAMDGRVIARKGDRIDTGFVNRLPKPSARDIDLLETIGESQHFYSLKMLLQEPKYRCISDLDQKKSSLLEIIASIRLNGLLMKELNWLERYGYHYDHTLAVTALVACMCMDYYENERNVIEAVSCALTYDIGMMRVPEEIFLKVSALTTEERKIIDEHPIYSHLLLGYYGFGDSSLNAEVALEHHEDLTGKGYPRGIPPKHRISQMVQMADIFDALITTRPYRPSKSPETALAIIAQQEERGQVSSEVYSLLASRIQPGSPMQLETS